MTAGEQRLPTKEFDHDMPVGCVVLLVVVLLAIAVVGIGVLYKLIGWLYS